MGDSRRLNQYYSMVAESKRAKKEFIERIDRDPSLILAADQPYYHMVKSSKFTTLMTTSAASWGFLIYWMNKINLQEQKGKKLYACIGLIAILPFYLTKLSYGRDTELNYEEYLYAKYVLYKSKPK